MGTFPTLLVYDSHECSNFLTEEVKQLSLVAAKNTDVCIFTIAVLIKT